MAKKPKKRTKKTVSKAIKVNKTEEKTKTEQIKKTKIRVIGIGGGGGNIVSEIASKISKASFVAANTDLKSLKGGSKKVTKFQFGQGLTHGLGTGMNPELGKAAAQSEKERIKKILEGQDLCILVVSLGGGTGSGAVSTFSKISKSLGNLTYGIFTLPFKFEGEKKMEIALNSLKEIRNYLNILTIIPNERVFQIINKDTPLKEALSTINKFLSENLSGLIETIYEPGLINIDFADFKTILEGRGRLVYLNTIEAQRKEGAIKDIAAKVLNSPLYPYTIRGAKGVLFNIAGEKNLSLSDVNQISKTISEMVNYEAKIIFGISQHKKYSNIIKIILLATGCGLKLSSPTEPRKSLVKVKKRTSSSSPTEPRKSLVKTKRKRVRKRKKPAGSSAVRRTTEEAPAQGKRGTRQAPKENKYPTGQAEVREKRKKKIKIRVLEKTKEEKSQESEGEESKLSSSPFAKARENKEKERAVPDNNNEERVVKEDRSSFSPFAAARVVKEDKSSSSPFAAARVRKNALQIKKEAEELEKAMLEKEKIWEKPAFLRKK